MDKKKSGVGRPIVMDQPWGELASKVGGTIKLAEELGIAKSTLNRWYNKNSRIPLAAKKEIQRLCEKHGVEFKILP